jgi:hypothetical protein
MHQLRVPHHGAPQSPLVGRAVGLTGIGVFVVSLEDLSLAVADNPSTLDLSGMVRGGACTEAMRRSGHTTALTKPPAETLAVKRKT